MDGYHLAIGSPALSSWSLRAWLVLRHFGLTFEETVIELDRPETRARILAFSPAGRVPVLRHGALAVWESLAIVEYLAERHPERAIWPADAAARALARSLAAEMHAGFAALRQALPMNITARLPATTLAPEVRADIERVQQIWRETRVGFGAGGAFLFGAFTAADAMFAPVASRCVSYAVALEPEAAAYRDALWTLPAMREWRRKAGEAGA